MVTAMAFLPIISKSAVPLLWIEYANENGWTSELQEIGLRLLFNGRIEVAPMWASYALMILGAILLWFGVKVWQNRYESSPIGDARHLGYWINFYWLKKPIDSVTVIATTDAKKPQKKAQKDSVKPEAPDSKEK